MDYNLEFWEKVDLFYGELDLSLSELSSMFKSDVEFAHSLTDNWFFVDVPLDLRNCLRKFDYMGLASISSSNYFKSDIEKYSYKISYLNLLKEVKGSENIQDKRFATVIYLLNFFRKNEFEVLGHIAKALCKYPSIEDSLYDTENLINNKI